jgi:hypothetical protein
MLVDHRLECRIGGVPVAADLPREGQREVPPPFVGLLLRGGERRLRVAALDLDERESRVRDCLGANCVRPCYPR